MHNYTDNFHLEEFRKIRELLETLADLSLEGETFQICHAALRLQTVLLDHYTKPD